MMKSLSRKQLIAALLAGGLSTGLSQGNLEAVKGELRPSVCRYDRNHVLATWSFAGIRAGGEDSLTTDSSVWTCSVKSEPAGGIPGCSGLECRFRVRSGEESSAGVALAFAFGDWSTENYVFVPAAAYAGNRFDIYPVGYPPYFYDPKYHKPGLPVTITDFPHLNKGEGISKMELSTGDMSTPCAGFFSPLMKKGILLLTEQQTRFGNTGLIIEESRDRTMASFVFNAPAVREFRAAGAGRVASSDRGGRWKAGDEVMLRFRVYIFPAENIAAFLDTFFTVRKSLIGPTEYRCLTPFSRAFQMVADVQNSERYFAKEGYYKNGNGDSPFGHIQLGWVGGLMQTYPMLVRGDSPSIHRSLSTMHVILSRMPGRSGFLYGMYRDSVLYGDNFNEMEKYPQVAMVRKNADALYWLIKHFTLLRAQHKEELIDPQWERAARALADAFVRLWKKYGEFGQFIDVETGDIVVGGSDAGASAIGGLAWASTYFGEKKYRTVAEQAGEFYARRAARRGFTCGGPGETLQSPGSDSDYALLESLLVLYELTGKASWVTMAEPLAHLLASWTVSYDYRFPQNSALGRAKARTTGAIFASAQNKHAAPGNCTASGNALLKLFRATGDDRYLDLLRDQAHNIIEFMSTKERPVGSSIDGYINERVQLSDWEGGDLGQVNESSVSWCELALMLTCLEIPGIYVQADKGTLTVFDHVEAKVLERGREGITLEVKNPTSYDARVSILSETRSEMSKPLLWHGFLKWPAVFIKAGSTRHAIIRPDGNVE
jgi:hypothetical protein